MSCTLLFMTAAVLAGLAVTAAATGAEQGPAIPAMPMPIDRTETADARWLAKPVLESRLLSDMETPDRWTSRGPGKVSFTAERSKDGKQSLRMVTPTWPDSVARGTGRPPAEAVARFDAGGADWSAWNRLSIWVYPDAPGMKHISFLIKVFNDGAEKLPGSNTRGAFHHVLLANREWNHVVFEIPHLTRDKVTGLEFIYRLQGSEPGAARTITLDMDRLELQKVDADVFEGWNVVPGRISYSHTGYPPDAAKTAIASGLKATEFRLIDAAAKGAGAVVLTGSVRTVKTRLGEFQVLDFSEVRRPGSYLIEAGPLRTPPFRIDADLWRGTILKTISFFYSERCGCAVPGVHDVCHEDVQCTYGDKTIVTNGGWHDAGDLSQGLTNTAEAAYAMFDLAAAVAESDPALSKRLVEEGRWGLDWILKTRFGGGFRIDWQTLDYWTDNKIGTNDDTTVRAGSSAIENAQAASAEAMAARVLKTVDPARAEECLKAARDDWQFGPARLRPQDLESASIAALASVELFKATGEKPYADKAVELADVILDCQQRTFTTWSPPMAGFYYAGTRKDRILHYFHRGHEQAPAVALAELCRALPDHPNWMKWYASAAMHGEYLKRIAEFTAPYCMVPASVYSTAEPDRGQVVHGVKLDDTHYLRMFPTWGDYRGNSGTGLSQTKALSAAALLRGDRSLLECALLQLEWTVGRNPFAQSLMYGEGHDYAPQYTATSGDMVGSLPVGIQSLLDHDVPYWPAATCYNYKEVWVHPSARWLAVQRDLSVMAQGAKKAPAVALAAAVKTTKSVGGPVPIEVTVQGKGRATLAIRTYNLKVEQAEQPVDLSDGKQHTVRWSAEVVDAEGPWFAVVVPDGRLADKVEVYGGWPPASQY